MMCCNVGSVVWFRLVVWLVFRKRFVVNSIGVLVWFKMLVVFVVV